MASTIKALYGSNNQSITCTLTSLANNGQRGSAAVDNTTNLYLDAMVQLKIKTGGSGIGNPSQINVYAYGTSDGGTDYTDAVTGTDASQTLTSPPNVKLIGVINVTAASTTYVGGPFSVAAAFGGILTDHWGIVVENKTGGAFDGTTASAWYQGVQQQVV
jgi:hypothetical protein